MKTILGNEIFSRFLNNFVALERLQSSVWNVCPQVDSPCPPPAGKVKIRLRTKKTTWAAATCCFEATFMYYWTFKVAPPGIFRCELNQCAAALRPTLKNPLLPKLTRFQINLLQRVLDRKIGIVEMFDKKVYWPNLQQISKRLFSLYPLRKNKLEFFRQNCNFFFFKIAQLTPLLVHFEKPL